MFEKRQAKTERVSIIPSGAIVERGSPLAANRTFAALRKFFNWCKSKLVIKVSPCDVLKPPSPETSRDRVLSDEEIRLLWQCWDGTLAPIWGTYFKVLLLTAQRRTEVAEMRWADIDLEKKLWLLPREQTKSDREHSVPLSDEVVALIEKMQRPEDDGQFVFSHSDGQGPIRSFSNIKSEIDENAATDEPWRIHDLRRTAATGMAGLGTTPQVLWRCRAARGIDSGLREGTPRQVQDGPAASCP